MGQLIHPTIRLLTENAELKFLSHVCCLKMKNEPQTFLTERKNIYAVAIFMFFCHRYREVWINTMTVILFFKRTVTNYKSRKLPVCWVTKFATSYWNQEVTKRLITPTSIENTLIKDLRYCIYSHIFHNSYFSKEIFVKTGFTRNFRMNNMRNLKLLKWDSILM